MIKKIIFKKLLNQRSTKIYLNANKTTGRAFGHFPRLTEDLGLFYSVLRLFTGLAIAALIAWKLTVNKVIVTAANAASTNTCHLIVIL